MSERHFLVVRFDVTDLTRDERDALTSEVLVQAESSEGHPDVHGVDWFYDAEPGDDDATAYLVPGTRVRALGDIVTSIPISSSRWGLQES